MRRALRAAAVLAVLAAAPMRALAAGVASQVPAYAAEVDDPAAGDLGKIHHLVVIYLENRSFDHLYGEFPGADGLKDSIGVNSQRDRGGRVYGTLPAIRDTLGHHFPASALANRPFAIDDYLPARKQTR